MTEQNSNKVRATKNKVQNAFLLLAAEKKIEKISVRELTDRAGINRSTFYAHYQDIDDLKEQVVEHFRDFLQERIMPILLQLALEPDLETVAQRLISIFEQNRQVYRAFLVVNRDDSMVEDFRRIAKEMLSLRFAAVGELPPDADYVLEFVIGGHLSLLAYWAQSEDPIPAARLVALVRILNYEGTVACLS